jgi:hypothetical protein
MQPMVWLTQYPLETAAQVQPRHQPHGLTLVLQHRRLAFQQAGLLCGQALLPPFLRVGFFAMEQTERQTLRTDL